MAKQDTAYRWHHWSVSAPKEKLLELVSVLDSKLPLGWNRVTSEELEELSRNLLLGQWTLGAYRYDQTPGRSGVHLVLELWHESELRGGKMQALFPATPAERAVTVFAGAEVDRFIDEGLLPAAARVGLMVRKASAADIYFEGLPWEVREALMAFSHSARKLLPLDWAEGEAWQAFVVAAYRSPTDFDRDRLREWFVANGWAENAAAELVTQFFDQCRLLSRYHDALVIA